MNWPRFLDLASKLLPALAVLVAGGWVLFNYFEGRTHRPRLQLHVSADRVAQDGLEYLVMKTELINVGLAKVKIVNDGCALTVFVHQLPRKVGLVMEPKWKELASFELFSGQTWVEPSGSLTDQQLVALPDLADRFVKVGAHVESAKVAWNAYVLVGRVPQHGPDSAPESPRTSFHA